MTILPPTSLETLMSRAYQLAGKTIGEVANQCQQSVPTDLTRSKGFIGQLIEQALGADAQSLDQPDFLALGVELKTLPIDATGKVRESTFICSAPLPFIEENFDDSRVYRKMAHILWCPIITEPQSPLSDRILATPILWQPSCDDLRILKQDWEELTTLMKLGQFDQLSAHHGEYLQIRPKAMHAKTFVQVIAADGECVSTVPKGFYLRTKLTQTLINRHYA